MRTFPLKITAFVLFLLIIAAAPAIAQDPEPSASDEPRQARQQRRPNLLRDLDLTPEQVQQLQQLNRERRPLMAEAQKALREANRELDETIYADRVSDGDVADKIRTYQAAQAEVARLRFENELEVRKILTTDQLVKFREARQKFFERRQMMPRRERILRRQQMRNRRMPTQQPPQKPGERTVILN